MVGIKKDGYDRSRTCVSRVKSPVHSRFATYPDDRVGQGYYYPLPP